MPNDQTWTTTWTTRIPPSYTAPFGCAELHAVAFRPNDDRGGQRHSVIVNIPETPDDAIRHAFAMTNRLRARMVFLCNTRRQARQVAERATKQLPEHSRIAIERAIADMWGPLT
ncbi:MAG: hypothetical protein FWD12_11230 [Alphaproteobacteria bacterium]|nr:hypothetical protein [Alphaproteobacteria bacterium]